MLRKLIRWARISKAGTDDKQFAVQQVDYMGKTADTMMIFPYGTHANVPADSLALMFSVQGDAANRASIAWEPKERPTLAEGEVAFYHPLIPNFLIKLQANGEMLIKSDVKVFMDAPSTEITGDLTVGGDFNVDGAATLGGPGGPEIARKGDAVAGGVITGGSTIHKAT